MTPVLDVTSGTDFLMTFDSTKRVVILSEAKDLLYAPFLCLHPREQIACVVYRNHQRHSSSRLGAQAQRVPWLHRQIPGTPAGVLRDVQVCGECDCAGESD